MTDARLPTAKDFSLRENVEWSFLAVATLLDLKDICDELYLNLNQMKH